MRSRTELAKPLLFKFRPLRPAKSDKNGEMWKKSQENFSVAEPQREGGEPP